MLLQEKTQRNSQSDRQNIIKKKPPLRLKKKKKIDMTLSDTKTQKPFCEKKGHIQLSAALFTTRRKRCAEISDYEMASNILYCWNITYHRKLLMISSSRPSPLGWCGQSSSPRLFAQCYHSLPRFPSLACRRSCPTNVG